MPKSVSYKEYLISRLKDPLEAAGYIEAILEEDDPEPWRIEYAKRAS